MRPLASLGRAEARALRGVVFDLDDTLLDHGSLGEAAYRALFRLREAGLELFACTGRPAGWAEVVARQWPIDAAIAENGAVAFIREGARIRRVDACAPEERANRRRRLIEIATELMSRHPELGLADDNGARISDVTFDIGEYREVARSIVAEARSFAEAKRARTFVSSVHMHATFDAWDKASGTIALLCARGVDASSARARYAYVGDSENDAAAFAAFGHTFGVANVRPRVGRLSVPPRFVAPSERGAGFAEIAAALSSLRS